VSAASADDFVWNLESIVVDPPSGEIVGCVNDACTGSIDDGSFTLDFQDQQNNQTFAVVWDSPPQQLVVGAQYLLSSAGSAGGSGPTSFRVSFCHRSNEIADLPPAATDDVDDVVCTVVANNLADVPQSDVGTATFLVPDPGSEGKTLAIVARVRFWAQVTYTYRSALAGAGNGNLCGNVIVDPGEDCDIGADNGRPTLCCSADCKYQPGKICFPSRGACDIPEVCDGLSVACPSDDVRDPGTVCRAAVDFCDLEDVCDGISPFCPADVVRPTGFICRIGFDDCDADEICDGISPLCPPDSVVPQGVVCRPGIDLCDADETCDGVSTLCPSDGVKPLGTVCRGVEGACDVAEACDGVRTDCPGDAVEPAATVCRSAAGACDIDDACDGISKTCGTDIKSTSVCRASSGDCDPAETCDGQSDDCPADALFPPGFVCRAALGDCDEDEHCDGVSASCPVDGKSSAVCRPATSDCDESESCDGATNACPADVVTAAGEACLDDGNICTDDACDGIGSCIHSFDATNDASCVETTTTTSTTTTTLQPPGTVTRHSKISETSGGFDGLLAHSDNFGSALAPLAGLHGDGPFELLVGAPDAGRGGAVWTLDTNDAVNDVAFERKIGTNRGGFPTSLDALARFGQSAVAIGDLDGDGYEDLAVGAPGDDDGGTDESSDLGAIWILFLNRTGEVRTEPTGSGVQKISVTEGGLGDVLAAGDRFGESIAALGEPAPGTGVSLAVGAPGDDFAGEDSGAVWILSLDSNGFVTSKHKIDATAGTGGAPDPGGAFGSSVVEPGDIDGDGNTDLVVGAPGTGTGSAWVLLLDTDRVVRESRRIDPNDLSLGLLEDGDQFGSAVASIAGGVAVGAPGDDDGGVDQGAVWLLSLDDAGAPTSGQKISACVGSFGGMLAPGDRFGSAIVSLGDLDDDGVEELAVGAPFDDDSRNGEEATNRGAVWILSLGPHRDNTFTCPVTTTTVTTSTTTTTIPVDERACGDANGDGRITAQDALRALQNAIGIDGVCPLRVCDANGDGILTASDALAILLAAVGLLPPEGLPCSSESTTTTFDLLPTTSLISIPVTLF
jgi:hypothetical protein